MRHLVAKGTCALTATALVAGCGSGGATSTTTRNTRAWTGAVCRVLAGIQFERRQLGLAGQQIERNPTATRSNFDLFVSGAMVYLSAEVAHLRSFEFVPDVRDDERLGVALAATIAKLSRAFSPRQSGVTRLSASSEAALAAGIRRVVPRLQSAVSNAVLTSVQILKRGGLGPALASTKACVPLPAS